MKIGLNVNGEAALRKALQDIGRQAPYALSLALNDTANDAQTSVRDGLSNAFTLRRAEFVKRTIYRNRATDFARKDRLQAIVRVNPERDFLAQHEEGGRKVPMSGSNVAVPLPAVQPNATAVVPRSLRPAALRRNAQVRKITTKNGTFLVRNRPGTGKGRLVGWRTEFLYELKRSVPIRPRLKMLDTASRSVDATFVARALQGIDRALASAR